LKIKVSTEITRLKSFEKYEAANRENVVATYPGVHRCRVNGKDLSLQSPRLSAAQFESVLAPFLERDILYACENEYRSWCSIFAPVSDALKRGRLSEEDLDFCLFVGGSSLIPQVQEALKQYLPNARILTYSDREAVQTAVARGAAYHSLSLALFGRGLV